MRKSSAVAWLGGVVVGAAAMYFLDPRSGRRRRAEAGQQAGKWVREVEHELMGYGRDLGNRARGQVARASRRLHADLVEDHRLEARVRSALGRLTTSPRAIRAEVRDGIVTLSGPVPDADLGYVLTGLRRIPGVLRVESRLDPIHGKRGGNSAHARDAAGGRAATGGEPLAPPARLLVGSAGGLLALWGLRRGGAAGATGAALGGWLIARSAVDEDAHPWIASGGPPVPVQRSIEIAAPVREVFAAWTDFSSFPRFMSHLREVRESDGGISHWVADGPAGMPVSWTAEIVSLQPFRRITWRSLAGSMIRNSGEVRFEDVTEDRTRIHVRMAYQPPAGQIGRAVAACFGADPRRQLDDDLHRFKALLEAARPASPARAPVGVPLSQE